jgi:hypothetical protein
MWTSQQWNGLVGSGSRNGDPGRYSGTAAGGPGGAGTTVVTSVRGGGGLGTEVVATATATTRTPPAAMAPGATRTAAATGP